MTGLTLVAMGSSTTTINALVDAVIGREGGYSNHPADRGGPTCFGITETVARANGYSGDMRSLPRDLAASIYKRLYWTNPGFATVALTYPVAAAELFDTGINMGPSVAAGFLQRVLNALNRGESDYPDLVLDSRLGPATFTALKAFARLRGTAGEATLVKALDALQGERYITLAERRGANEAFVYGWLEHRLGQAR